VIRVAAIGDMHFSESSAGTLRPHWLTLRAQADVLLVAGDLTTHGEPGQARVIAEELADLGLPVVAVLGNHEYHTDQVEAVRQTLEKRGIIVLEGQSTTLSVGGERLGVAGTKGFGGGFSGASLSAFGEPELKAFIRRTEQMARQLQDQLAGLREVDHRVALMHYAPVKDTVAGERTEIYPALGSYLLAQAIDAGGADLAVHGHAHQGHEKGVTPGGVPVRNVALPLLRRPFALLCLDGEADSTTCTSRAGSLA
jgi:Icc-related predicted phosphoesterase